MNIKTLGIDLAKNTFQLQGVDDKGQAVLKKKVSRKVENNRIFNACIELEIIWSSNELF